MNFWNKYSRPVDDPTLRVISLGAGVQSTVLSLMAARGDIGPMPHAAIFADTGREPTAVYTHLDWLCEQLPFPVYIVSAGNIRQDIVEGYNDTEKRFVAMPFFLSDGGMGQRQCTYKYKIEPIHRKVRELCGLEKGQRATDIEVEQWIGISTDEFTRMKDSRTKWVKHRWPLLEEEMSRADCQRWFHDRYPGRTLAKSACIECPYHDNQAWQSLTKEELEEACQFDELIRIAPGLNKQQYLHQDRIPLREVDVRKPTDRGQIDFLDECDGMCGL